jgi:penicillin-binding protein 1A
VPLLVLVAVPACLLAVAWWATPGVADLPVRVAGQVPPGQARPVALAAIAPLVPDALIATEDERFRSNPGIDLIGLLRAIPYDASHLSLAQGGSTITQQLAKNLWLHGSDQAAWSKLQDVALALKLGRRWSKDEILAAYLGSAYFGQGAYGIAEASRRYFGVSPASLDDVQATVLVGLVQAPTSYDPYIHPAAARTRQISVLRSLVRIGRLTPSQAGRLLARPLPLADGTVVPGIAGVDLATGPAADWAGVALGALLACGGAATLVLRRRLGPGSPASRLAPLLGVLLLALSLVVASRSLRVL